MRILFVVVATMVLGISATVSIASASTATVVGSYTFTDLGQGGWAGGPLYSDGTVGGGGSYSIDNGESAGLIQAVSWQPAGPDAVLMCFTDTALKGQLLFPGTACFPLPATGAPQKISFAPGEFSIARVKLNH
jgi:hypothetical protein